MEMKIKQDGLIILYEAKTCEGLKTSVWLLSNVTETVALAIVCGCFILFQTCDTEQEYCIRLRKWPETWKAAACSEEAEF